MCWVFVVWLNNFLMVRGMKNIFLICVFVRCDFDMRMHHIKLKQFITIFMYRFVITIIKRVAHIFVVVIMVVPGVKNR